MNLIRFGEAGSERPGVIHDGRRVDVSDAVSDYDERFFAGDGLKRLASWVREHADRAPEVADDVHLGPPIARPSKIVCVGLNYADHARESGVEVPAEPILFFKATSSVTGPYDGLVIPRGSQKTDWEVELAVVIGRRAHDVPVNRAAGHIAGYTLHNDYSEREWQLERSGQWVKGKSADTFAPLGPWLATGDEIANPEDLRLWLTVNGETMQESSTRELIVGIDELVSYTSRFMTLLPGDVISTGTPPGVGLGRKPPVYVKPGDVIECGIDGLGAQRQVAVAEAPHQGGR